MRVATILLTFGFGLGTSLCWADSLRADEREGVRSGEIQIEDTSVTKRSPKVVNQEEAFTWLDGMKKFADGGGSGGAPQLSEGAAQHLAIMYLYCNYKRGVCPFILDSILESDIARTRGNQSPECPSMSAFWKAWIANDLEQRAKYLLSIGSATAVANFNSVERPKYVKCKETVANEARKGSEGRYGANGSVSSAVATTQKLAAEIKERQIDLYSSLGVSTTGDGKKGGGGRGKR